MKYIIDFDDFADSNNCLPQLLKIKEILPNFKATLFTIPQKISDDLITEILKYNWLQMALHGHFHNDNYEFANLTKEEAHNYLLEDYNFVYYVKGFKSPGWQINIETMEILKHLDFWVAVQYSDGRLNGDPNGKYQPAVIEGLKYYAFNELPEGYKAIHGHTWECCGNSIYKLYDQIINLPKDSEFIFINDYVNENFPMRPATA